MSAFLIIYVLRFDYSWSFVLLHHKGKHTDWYFDILNFFFYNNKQISHTLFVVYSKTLTTIKARTKY